MTDKEYVMHAMKNHRGDDLERAQRGFYGLPDAAMKMEYGQSGKTRQQILDEYLIERQQWEQAMKWLKTQGG